MRRYGLIETAEANGIDVCRYLCDLFIALPLAKSADDYEALLPSRLALQRNRPSKFGMFRCKLAFKWKIRAI
ncbi:transposase domain-containing protein [Paraburkholderia sp. WSM4175]|uniref:transposase domain-containing protein n=1 Tax=Paraburkholderia sp. WSM4175 TaxID=2991072 RepID=UPI003D1FAB5E